MKTLQIGMEWFPDRPGGLDRYYYDCCQYLPQADIEVTGLLAGSDQVFQESNGQVKAFASSKDSLPKRWLKMRTAFGQNMTDNQYDLVVSHFALYTFPILDQLRHLPLVTHFHGPWALESEVEKPKPMAIWLKKQIEKAVYRRSSQFIVLSQTFRDILHREYQVPLNKIHIIPGGVDIDRFNINLSSIEARTQLNWHPDKPIIFCIRRLAKRMGLENLITAMAQVRDRYPDILLYIAGKGALADTLQTQINELELTDHVKLLGYVPDEQLPLCYRAANFSVVPTVALEGFGLIVVESLAAGTPVLGTPIGGIPEILKPFSQDLVFEGYQPNQIAEGIIEALGGDRVLPSSEECLAYIRANYNWNAIAQKIKLVYQKASIVKKT
ncbi:glycosyl transferase group 1 [Stanieria cyanosphaera PCC 7437]|uniref:Glycosyl transferase group 1 n=1 Tax=Stanieria cyanosphaera (strain ATCC 29371 / PCC 7437) TaxID=111780 RepID=K9XRS5_STAC7|nr:glycosyltransferase family 4 protein [Stanieria cyanosphaera]AFZ34382.1 glycosyl transferase group 1 [Stanieria cyanosphaera PCC 7437]